jgi:uncharacterized protein YjbJ (UPF0337 family)
MGNDDRLRHEAEDVKGKAKEKAGEVTGDEETREEGVTEQAKSKFKKAGDKIKEAGEDAKDAFKRNQ